MEYVAKCLDSSPPHCCLQVLADPITSFTASLSTVQAQGKEPVVLQSKLSPTLHLNPFSEASLQLRTVCSQWLILADGL